MTKKISNVKSSKKYSDFKIVPFNRDINENRIESLQESIKEHGFILPILVNQNMMIVDGQHRFEAAKRINQDIFYIQYEIENDMLPILISKVNSVSKNWNINDYYRMWCNIGKDEYLYLSDLEKEYNIEFTSIYNLIRGYGRGGIMSAFKNGTFTLTETQKTNLVNKIKMFTELINYGNFSSYSKVAMAQAIVKIISNKSYSHDTMISQLEKYSGEIGNCSSGTLFIEQFEKVYNKGLRKNKIGFSRK